MTREFIMLPEFDKQWKAMGFSDNDLQSLQEELTLDPAKGSLMRGIGGLRKIRVAFENQGKSSSARVCYVDLTTYERIFLITAYPKNKKENISKEERITIKSLIKNLESTLKLK
jgi:hypothetical protein